MKKAIIILLIVVSIGFIQGVNANEVNYTNANGVSFSSSEISYIHELFYDGYENDMTITDYNNIFKNGLTPESKIEKVYGSTYVSRGTTHTTPNKSIVIGKSCSSLNCLITIQATWINLPVVRSYDVIGAYFSNTSALTTPTTKISSTDGTTGFSNNVIASNGLGCSVKLPNSATNIKITQYFYVELQGRVYASYQHATSNISLANSKRYSFSLGGYGNVFNFDSAVSGYYDQMAGVYINL